MNVGSGVLPRVLLVAIAVALVVGMKVAVLDTSVPMLLRESVGKRFSLGFLSGAMLGLVIGGICGLEAIDRYRRLASLLGGLVAGAEAGLASRWSPGPGRGSSRGGWWVARCWAPPPGPPTAAWVTRQGP